MTNILVRLSKVFSITLLMLFILLLGSCESESSGSLNVEMEADRNTKVNFTIRNNGSSDLLFFDVDTPIRGHYRQYFKITNELGEEVPYIGRIASIDLDSSNWSQLKSGEEMNFTVDLKEQYDFPPVNGIYNITYVFPVNIKKGNFSKERTNAIEEDFSSTLDSEEMKVVSNDIQVEIDNTYNENLRQLEATRSCTSSQLSVINSTYSVAKNMAQQSISYMNNNGMDSLWNTWWGVDNQGRYDFILNGFNKISDSFNINWTYNCPSASECSRAIIAWVYKGTPYKVWLCPGWFLYTSPSYRGSIMIHEASHWNVNLGTDDYGYGQTFCKDLAQSDPDKAKMNADNYDYFSYYTYNESDNNQPNGSNASKSSNGCGSVSLAPDL